MKCQSCNAPLSIEDEKCPYCGKPNPEAIQHRKDMHHFSNEFYRTRSSVLRMATENAGKSSRIIILCIMTLLFVLSLLFLVFSWDIGYSITKSQAASNKNTYRAMLDEYEKEGDYLSFAALFEQKSLYSIDAFQDYRYVYNAASNYTNIYNSISTLLEEESWEGRHEHAIESLCETLEYHYKFLETDSMDYYIEIGAYHKQHINAVDCMTEKIENLIQLTFAVPEEEMKQFKELSPLEKQVFIERRFQDHE